MGPWGLSCTSSIVKTWAITMWKADDLVSFDIFGYVNCADAGSLDLIVITFSGYNWIVLVNCIMHQSNCIHNSGGFVYNDFYGYNIQKVPIGLHADNSYYRVQGLMLVASMYNRLVHRYMFKTKIVPVLRIMLCFLRMVPRYAYNGMEEEGPG